MHLYDWEIFKPKHKNTTKLPWWIFLLGLFILIIIVGLWNYLKPLPEGLSFESKEHLVNLEDLSFLADKTYLDNQGQTVVDQKIFPTILNYVDQAEQYILLDMFLFNDGSKTGEVDKKLANELADHLIAKKQVNPEIKITVITDPINIMYGSAQDEVWQKLSAAGIEPITTNLSPLRDSNPLYSASWRVLFSWLGGGKHGWLPNPFSYGGANATLRGYLAIPNFKANHRKIFLADNQDRLVTVIASANPHGASYKNSNIAWVTKGLFAVSVYNSEQAVAALSKTSLPSLPENLLTDKQSGKNSFARARLVTEGKIASKALEIINSLQSGDNLDVAMFYLSERHIVEALKAATKRGVEVRLILDLNKEAFGYKKNGIPNHSVAKELVKSGAKVRWYQTHGEQFHSKMMIANLKSAAKMKILAGSANLTRRNIADYNLESDIYLDFRSDTALAAQVKDYFETLWYNKGGNLYTADYANYVQTNPFKDLIYRFQEFSGLSSF